MCNYLSKEEYIQFAERVMAELREYSPVLGCISSRVLCYGISSKSEVKDGYPILDLVILNELFDSEVSSIQHKILYRLSKDIEKDYGYMCDVLVSSNPLNPCEFEFNSEYCRCGIRLTCMPGIMPNIDTIEKDRNNVYFVGLTKEALMSYNVAMALLHPRNYSMFMNLVDSYAAFIRDGVFYPAESALSYLWQRVDMESRRHMCNSLLTVDPSNTRGVVADFSGVDRSVLREEIIRVSRIGAGICVKDKYGDFQSGYVVFNHLVFA